MKPLNILRSGFVSFSCRFRRLNWFFLSCINFESIFFRLPSFLVSHRKNKNLFNSRVSTVRRSSLPSPALLLIHLFSVPHNFYSWMHARASERVRSNTFSIVLSLILSAKQNAQEISNEFMVVAVVGFAVAQVTDWITSGTTQHNAMADNDQQQKTLFGKCKVKFCNRFWIASRFTAAFIPLKDLSKTMW